MAYSVDKPVPPTKVTAALKVGLGPEYYAQKVYSLGLNQIIHGPDPGDDLFVGWRYVYSVNPDVAVNAEVLVEQDGSPSYAGVSRGPRTAKALRAALQAESWPGVPDGKYELRVLRIPGILTDAYWLRSTSPANDLVIPYDTMEEGIEVLHVYRMAKFLEYAKVSAQQRIRARFED